MSTEFTILKELCHIPSPSNFEDEIVAYIQSFNTKLKNFECKVTKKKSCYFYNKRKQANKKTVMIDAHIDQVHLRIVNIIEDDGIGYVIAVAVGFDPDVLLGNSVYHLNSVLKGNIVTIPPHLNIRAPNNTKYTCVDFGMTINELKRIMRMGDAIIFDIDWYVMNNKYIVSTGLDNKVSVYVLLMLLEWADKNIDKLNVNLYLNFSSREEIGLGSYSPLLKFNIDEVIVLDTEIATDNQYISKNLIGNILLDNGVSISHNYDDDNKLTNKLIDICKDKKIDYQETFSAMFGATNLKTYSKYMDSYTQFIGIPLRNMHSPTEIVSMKVLKETIELMKEYIMR
jgi:endoglucanase